MKNTTNQIIRWRKGVRYLPGDEIPDEVAIALGLMQPEPETENSTETEKITTRKRKTT